MMHIITPKIFNLRQQYIDKNKSYFYRKTFIDLLNKISISEILIFIVLTGTLHRLKNNSSWVMCSYVKLNSAL